MTNKNFTEAAEDRKRNAMWAQITSYEKRAKETKNDIKRDHLMKMASELRAKLPTTDEEKLAESLAALEEAIAGDIGHQIKAVYKKIYDAGDDAVEFMYYDSPIFAQYWDEYEGDLDSIIAEVDPTELQIILDELQSAAEDQGVAEGWTKLPSGDYQNSHTGVRTSKPPVKKKRGEKTGAEWDAIEKAKKDQDLNEFAPPGSGDGDNEPDEYEILHRLAAMWWLGTEQQMIKAQRTLASMGWEIGEDEGYDDGGVFVVRANDEHGKSYISWPHEDLQLNEQGMAEGQLNEGEQLFYARNPDGTRTYARIKDSAQLAQLQQKYTGSEVKLMSFNRPDVAEWLVSRGVNMRGFLPGMVITRGLSEEENKPEPPEADYGDDYQDMVSRVKKLAGLGPLKTVYDPQKRVYKNVPTAVQPKKEQ